MNREKKHYSVIAGCEEEEARRLATLVLEDNPAAEIRILSGPQQGLVMLRVQETVADSLFNAGEILVTEVKLELDGEFGYGITLGHSPQRAMAMALVDAALRKSSPLSERLHHELARLEQQINNARDKLYRLVAQSKVEFETM